MPKRKRTEQASVAPALRTTILPRTHTHAPRTGFVHITNQTNANRQSQLSMVNTSSSLSRLDVKMPVEFPDCNEKYPMLSNGSVT